MASATFLDRATHKILKSLPLPISLPTPLRRAEGPVTDQELRGTFALLSRLRDDLDAALCRRLLQDGARVFVLDPEADRARLDALHGVGGDGGGLHHAPRDVSDPDAVLRGVKAIISPGDDRPRRPTTWVHRLPPLDADGPDVTLAAIDGLYSVGHAAANALPATSRVLFVREPATGHAADHIYRASLGGFLRALSKELGKKATTVHAVESLAGAHPAAVARIVSYLASPRASFLTALMLQVGPTDAAAADDATGPRRLLAGKVAVVTGSAQGIGAAIATTFAREGAHVFVNDLPQAEKHAARTLAKIRRFGVESAFLPFDVSTADGASALAEAVRQQTGHLDILVNNAGITRDRTIKRMSLERWQQVVHVNLGTQLRVSCALKPLLRDGGRIVHLSSVMGIAGNFGQTNYCAAKAGTIGLTHVLAEKLRPQGITVNAMAPGYIRTRLTSAMPLLNREMAKQLTALLQPGEGQDVAELATFLAGPDGQPITGQVLRVDGGMAVGA